MFMTRSLVMLLLCFSVSSVMAQGALELVKTTADSVLAKVVANRAALDKDPSGIYALVSDELIGHFDFAKMTRTAMGKYWRRASDAQKLAIQEQFRALLVRTYGSALLNYSGQNIQYLPLREHDEARVTVQTRVSETASGPDIPVDYRLALTDGDWKVYDVVIDGVSLVSNYRSSFSGQIRRDGIDGLIESLKANNRGQ